MLTRTIATLLTLAMLAGVPPATSAAALAAGDPTNDAGGRTPPRVSLVDGQASFWRPGAQDWAPAQVNTALAPGDELYTGHPGNIELQVGGRAFARAWGDTQFGLVNQDADTVQLKVTTGHLSLDLRSLDPGAKVEIDTPQAAFIIDRPGYYRADVMPQQTSFVTRRAGRATMTLPTSQVVSIAGSEQVVIDGAGTPTVQSYVAPEPDAWDRWNYARTDELLESLSARYVPAQVYGVDDLDHYGDWRVVQPYGAIWVPTAVSAGWAPYSTGKWVWDRYYGWTWVDAAPWGWAPFHHGRWVFVNGFWAWAPGPIVARPVYAPALVAFFGAPGIRIGIEVPFVSWVALGWGEPVVPWWGRAEVIGRPHWMGWGGPRVVNNVVVNQTTVVNVTNIRTYGNVAVRDAVVAVRRDQFSRTPVQETRIARVDTRQLEPVHGSLRIAPEPSSLVAGRGPAVRPPDAAVARRVVATRAPAQQETPPRDQASRPAAVTVPPPQVVAPSRPAPNAAVPARPPFGTSAIERSRPAPPPRFETPQRVEPAPPAPAEQGRHRGEPAREVAPPPAASVPPAAPVAPEDPGRNRVEPGRPVAPPAASAPAAGPADPGRHRGARGGHDATPPAPVAPMPPMPPAAAPRPSGRPEIVHPAPRALPGEPANRLFPGRQPGESRRPEPAAPPRNVSESRVPDNAVPSVQGSTQGSTPGAPMGAIRRSAGSPEREDAPAQQSTPGRPGHARGHGQRQER